MNYFNPLEYDSFYHIYNHANGFEDLFVETNCYASFLARLGHYLLPVIDIYSYNLLRNHFHLIIKVKSEAEIAVNSRHWAEQVRRPFKLLDAGKQFSDCFNSYTKSFNKIYSRSGSLFQERFRRVEISDEGKLVNLVGYVHTNAQHHRMVKDFRDWPYSSYHEAVSESNAIIQRDELLKIFNGKEQFIQFHKGYASAMLENDYWLE